MGGSGDNYYWTTIKNKQKTPLEQLKKDVNKWNGFSSEKYIIVWKQRIVF